MAYRQLKPRTIELVEPVETTLTAEQVTAYLRQSIDFQVLHNTESADLQRTGALRYAVSQGLNADKIVIAHEGDGKRGVSGSLRIDQREKLQEIVAGIKDGTIKVVWAYSVSRLFRDPYGVQVGVFIELCAEHGVKVVIENAKTFDFTNSFDVIMFQFLANIAAKENADRSLLLHQANGRKSSRGEFDGRPLVVGYIVDRVKLLADGKPNPSYGKFIEYVPHARVVRRLYARFRELGGQFNLLAAEVARMPVVFPDFEEWVSLLDVKKLQLKKVPGGYHISRVGLYHLMTAIEYAGYWKYHNALLVDAYEKPIINHVPIVDEADWTYAFTRLSHTDLQGLPNRERAIRTWVPANKTETRNTLAGILVSPLGIVQNADGKYRVVEQRPGISQRSNTLTVDAELIDAIWQARLIERIGEIDHDEFFEEQLARLKEQHASALVTVPEQIARYKKEREGIQAYIKAVGATADVATLQQFNAQLLEITAQITELEAKKQAAQAEESSLSLLSDRVARMNMLLGHEGGTKQSRNFIRLITEIISLDEYSGHFLTLTIVWRVPFQQVNICYIYRPDGGHQHWSADDEADLARLYPDADRLELLQRFPTRTWMSMYCWAAELGLSRNTRLNTSGITNRSLALADWQLLQQHGWELPSTKYGAYWLYDVKEANNVIEISSGVSHPH